MTQLEFIRDPYIMTFKRKLKITIAVLLITSILINLTFMRKRDVKSVMPRTHLNISDTTITKEHESVPSQRIVSSVNVSNERSQQTNCGDQVHLILGHKRPKRGFLTIGICTVPRSKAFYLMKTVGSLIERMTEAQREKVTIVVFLGFHNETESSKLLGMIENTFSESLETGGLQVVQPDVNIYPNFNKTIKNNFKDAPKRLRWRTKQNIDFAYLFGYCEKLSDFYLHVEDDLDASVGYISEMERFILKHQRNQWFVLEFGTGFYGQLFRSRDLCMMKKYFLLFQEEKPCDMLLSDLKRIMVHDFKKVKLEKKLFKHLGKYSSLEGKIFKDPITKKPLNKSTRVFEYTSISNMTTNPAVARIETSMNTYLNYSPELAYITNRTTFFWATTPKVGDYYRVILKSSVMSKRVAIDTGTPVKGTDRLEQANVYVNNELTTDGMCKKNEVLGTLKNGGFEHIFSEPEYLLCLEIVVTQTLKHWVVISQIEIET